MKERMEAESLLKTVVNMPISDRNTSLVGNTCLYGATGGEVYISGRELEKDLQDLETLEQMQ